MKLNWIEIKSDADLTKIIEESYWENVVGIAIFKHSTCCSISSIAKNRLASFWDFNKNLPIYYLDLIAFRSISDNIAEKFNIRHESPQLLVIKNGQCVFDASHLAISVKSLHKGLEIKN